MGKLSSAKCCFLLLSVMYLCSIETFARRSGGGGGGGGMRASSGGSFGRSAGSSSYGRSGGGGYRSSSGWGSSGGGGGGFGGSSRTASATRYSSPSGTGGGTFGGGSATRYGSSGASGSSGRYGGGLGSSGASATRYGSSSPTSGAVGGSSATRYGSSGASATRYGSPSSSSGRIGGTGTAMGSGAAGGAIGNTRYGGGSYSGAGSSAGRVAAAPTLTRYGSQQSTGGIFGSSGSAGGGTRWGSSAASGTGRAGTPLDSMRTRFAGSGSAAGSVRSPSASAGNARPNYGSGGSNTMSRARPQVQAPTPTRSQPTKVVYSTTYNNYHNAGSRYGTGGFGGGSSFLGGGSRSGFGTGSLVATGLAAGVGGYALGRMMGSLSRPYGYGGYGYGGGYGGGYGYPGYGGMGYGGMGGCGMYGCSPYTSYVPYRDRYQEYYPTPAPAPAPAVDQYNPNTNQGSGSGVAPLNPVQTSTEAPKNIDLCMLARWNRELAFAEMPNMALDFLINNNVSGNSTSDKAKFMHDFLTVSVDAYEQYNSSADIFAIPPTFDLKTCNIKVSKSSLINAANAVQTEEPILTSIRHMLSLYSNKSANPDDLRDVVDAAKACLPQGPTVTNPEVLGCIDFSLSPEQMLKLEVPHSMFGSSEICRRQLSPDTFKCVPKAIGSPCKLEHLANLNLFARNFYLCSEATDDSTFKQTDSTNTNQQSAPSPPATTRYPVIPITTAQPSFWSRIFG